MKNMRISLSGKPIPMYSSSYLMTIDDVSEFINSFMAKKNISSSYLDNISNRDLHELVDELYHDYLRSEAPYNIDDDTVLKFFYL